MNKIKGVVIAIILSIFMNGGIVALGADDPKIDFKNKVYVNSKNDYTDPGITNYEAGEVDSNDANKEQVEGVNNVRVGTGKTGEFIEGKKNDVLDKTFDGSKYLRSGGSDDNKSGLRSIRHFILTIAKEIKNIIFAIASIYLIILIFRLLIAEDAEDEFGKTKKGIIRTTIGIITMQIAFSATTTLVGTTVDAGKATSFVANIAQPLIDMLLYVVPFMFMAIAIYSFFKIVTANGDETKIKQGRMSIVHATIAIIVIKVSQALVNSIYGMINCNQGSSIAGAEKCIEKPNVGGVTDIFFDIINWANSFLAIIITIIFIYTGFSLITAAGDKAKMEKARKLLVYVVAGVILIVGSYAVVNFFPLNDINSIG